MTQEYEVRIPARELVALDLARELINRKFEDPKNSAEFLKLYCRCLVTIANPEGAIAIAASHSELDATDTGGAIGEHAAPRGDF